MDFYYQDQSLCSFLFYFIDQIDFFLDPEKDPEKETYLEKRVISNNPVHNYSFNLPSQVSQEVAKCNLQLQNSFPMQNEASNKMLNTFSRLFC